MLSNCALLLKAIILINKLTQNEKVCIFLITDFSVIINFKGEVMSTARKILLAAWGTDDAIKRAESHTLSIKNDYVNKCVVFSFNDRSKLVVQNSSIYSFEDFDEMFEKMHFLRRNYI